MEDQSNMADEVYKFSPLEGIDHLFIKAIAIAAARW